MKKPTIVFFLLLAVFYSHAQKIKAYEYWVDDDVSAKVVTSIAPVATLHLQQALSVDQASAGLHVFNIRFADTTNTWSSVLRQFFVKNPPSSGSNRQIVGYEYWFDDAYALTIYQPTSPAAQFHLADNLNLNSLSYGVHVLNIRFKDDLGSWSTILNQFFVNNPPSNGSSRQMVGYEYWFDDGYADKTYQQIAPSAQFHLADNLNLNSVSYGLHVFNIRFKDDMGSWSSLLTQFFINYGAPRIIPNQTVAYRFWFDNDMATEETFNLQQPAPVYNWADTVETPFLTVGNHIFNYQFKDSNKVFSSIRTDTFSVASCLPHGGRAIAGAASVCVGQTGVVYSIRKIKNAVSYTWSVPSGATIIAGSNTHSITVDYSMASLSGSVSVYATNSCGNGGTMTFPVTVNPLPVPAISGPASACVTSTGNIFSTQTGMSGYIWTVSSGGTITAGTGTNAITVTWNAVGPQTVSVNYTNENNCTAVSPTVYNVTVNPLPVPTISGPVSVCRTSAGNVYSTQTGMTSYAWTVSAGGAITAGSGTKDITVTWNTAGAKTISVNYINANGCAAAIATVYNVTVNPLPVPTISGPASLCITSTGNVYSTQSDMTGYFWTVSAGGTITGGIGTKDITVTWNTAGAKTVSVNYTNSNNCTAGAPTVYNVTVNPLPVPTISGSALGCVTTTGNSYSTQTGMTGYLWNVSSGGTITSGTGTNAIAITWNISGAQSVSVNYTNSNSCTAATPTVYNVAVNPLPIPTISGVATVCRTSTGNVYSTQTGMTGYLWTVSAGGTITAGAGTKDITVTWNTAGAQTVSVNYTNANYCTAAAPTAYNVTVNALPVPAISGPASACVTSTGNIFSTQTGMSGYLWTVSSGGTITSGTGTNAIAVSWNTMGEQTVSVNYTNASSCTAAAPTIYNVTVNPLPVTSGSITGPAQVVQGQTGIGYSVSPVDNATGYVWTLPPGALIATGENTNSINVDFGAAAVSGDIIVHGTNSCGSGAESQVLNVRVIPTAISIENISIGNLEAKCYNAAQTIFVAGNGTSFEVQTGGSATLIAGQKIIFQPTVTVALGGSMHGYITSNNEYCGTQKTPMVAIVAGGQESILQITSASFKVYPNPTTGSFTLEFVDKTTTGKVEVLVCNMHGEKLLTQEMAGERSRVFSLSGRPPGVYIVHVLTGETSETVKVIKQ